MVQLIFTGHACGHYTTQHVSENVYNIAYMCMKDWWHQNTCEVHACTHNTLCAYGLHEQHVCVFSLHELHSCILACTSTCFSTNFVCFIGVHAGLAYSYTSNIHSNPDTCMHTYCWYHREHNIPFIGLEVHNVNSVNTFN